MKAVKRKQPKRVRCWMETYSNGSKCIPTSKPNEVVSRLWGSTITPGYFVPDEPKPKPKPKRKGGQR